MEKKVGYFGNCGAFLASLKNREDKSQSYYWKTSQLSLIEGWEQSLEHYPKSGMMQNGSLFELVILERPTKEKDGFVSATLPTPTMSDYKRRGPNSKQQGISNVESWIHRWNGNLPTPQRRVFKNNPSTKGAWGQKSDLNVSVAKMMGYTEKTIGKKARLNPQFVRWMMGFPIGWLD